MPALQPVPGVLRISVSQSLAGIPVVNVFHLLKSSPGPWLLVDAQAAASWVRGSWVSRFIPRQTNTLTLGTVAAVDLTSNVGVSATASGSTAGAQAGQALPASVAMCVSWPIPRHYRGGHPRTYFAGVLTTDTTNPNTWQGATVTAWTSAATAFRTDLNALVNSDASTNALVCVHRYAAHATLIPPATSVLGVPAIDTRIDSQRRRLGKDR